jgi:hypothetical protein
MLSSPASTNLLVNRPCLMHLHTYHLRLRVFAIGCASDDHNAKYTPNSPNDVHHPSSISSCSALLLYPLFRFGFACLLQPNKQSQRFLAGVLVSENHSVHLDNTVLSVHPAGKVFWSCSILNSSMFKIERRIAR